MDRMKAKQETVQQPQEMLIRVLAVAELLAQHNSDEIPIAESEQQTPSVNRTPSVSQKTQAERDDV